MLGLRAALVAVLSLSSLAAANTSPSHRRHHAKTDLAARSPNNSKKVIASLFDWNWDSVGKECSFLGSAGYGYVQVSTSMEHIQGDQWWVDYQAVSYKIQNRRGTRSQFQTMVNKCHSAGVKVIVDVIFNHMAGISSGTGYDGTKFTQYNYPGTYSSGDFHYCTTPGHAIQDWSSQYQVETCQLENLADLNTESTSVRNKIIGHANDLLSLGVDGFRIDAAKHIHPTSINAIVGGFSRKPSYITQEVVDTNGTWANMHTAAGDVQDLRFAYTMLSSFTTSQGIAGLKSLDSWGWLASDKANVFVTNHDTERDGSGMSYKNGASYTLAHVYLLASDYGTKTVHSGFSFSNTDQGPPSNSEGSCSGTGPTGGWECQHRWGPIVGMVGFYNHVGTSANSDSNNYVTSGSNRLAFGRGALGHVALNNEGSSWTVTLKTELPAGSYCDVAWGSKSGSKCTGLTVKVSGGKFTVTVPANKGVAIHTGAKL